MPAEGILSVAFCSATAVAAVLLARRGAENGRGAVGSGLGDARHAADGSFAYGEDEDDNEHVRRFLAEVAAVVSRTKGQRMPSILRMARRVSDLSRVYAAQFWPKRIVLVRHGEAVGNVDTRLFSRVPDNRMKLTEKGKLQAQRAGKDLRRLIADESLRFFYSPYTRTKETMAHIIDGGFSDHPSDVVLAMEDARLREQDFGNLQDPEAMSMYLEERKSFGRFYYRYPNGESGADVYSRVEGFHSSLKRKMDNNDRLKIKNFVIISHGLTIRLYLMRILRWTVEQFEQVLNPQNCAIIVLEKAVNKHGNNFYRISTPEALKVADNEQLPNGFLEGMHRQPLQLHHSMRGVRRLSLSVDSCVNEHIAKRVTKRNSIRAMQEKNARPGGQ